MQACTQSLHAPRQGGRQRSGNTGWHTRLPSSEPVYGAHGQNRTAHIRGDPPCWDGASPRPSHSTPAAATSPDTTGTRHPRAPCALASRPRLRAAPCRAALRRRVRGCGGRHAGMLQASWSWRRGGMRRTSRQTREDCGRGTMAWGMPRRDFHAPGLKSAGVPADSVS